MNPRYKISQKWTPFPVEFTDQIRSVFMQNFAKELGTNTTIHVEGRIYQKEITLRVGLHNKGELKHLNFEASIDLPAGEDKQVFEQISIAVDALGSLVAEYYENDQDIELPYVWTEITFDKKKVWIQHSTENPNLEAEANKLLGVDDEAMVKNSDDEKSEDVLDITEDEFDEFAEQMSSEPQMFKKNKKDDLH
ncbi:MAG: hypothetical protein ACK41T_06250 [Pseudobdellovibrio sp.]